MNVKKQPFLLFFVLLAAWPMAGRAQNDDIPLREVSVGMGIGTSNLKWNLSSEDTYDYWFYREKPLAAYRHLKIYDDGSVQPPCYTVAFRQDFKVGRWMSYGLTASYEYTKNTWKSRLTDKTVATSRDSYFTLMPALRYYYLRHRGFRMYTEAGVGVSLRYTRRMEERSGHHKIRFTGQFTGFGIQMGKRVFFGSELGYGCLGVARMIAGYRF